MSPLDPVHTPFTLCSHYVHACSRYFTLFYAIFVGGGGGPLPRHPLSIFTTSELAKSFRTLRYSASSAFFRVHWSIRGFRSSLAKSTFAPRSAKRTSPKGFQLVARALPRPPFSKRTTDLGIPIRGGVGNATGSSLPLFRLPEANSTLVFTRQVPSAYHPSTQDSSRWRRAPVQAIDHQSFQP